MCEDEEPVESSKRAHGPSMTYSGKRLRWLRRLVFRRDGHRCRSRGLRGRLDADHIQPVADGGDRRNPDNLQTLCRSCHIDKTAAENRTRTRTHPKPPEVEAWLRLVAAMLDGG